MSPQSHRRIREDLELMDRFSRAYRSQFASLIDDLNAPDASPQVAGRGLRLCVEAVGMLLSLQQQLAETLRVLSSDQAEPVQSRPTLSGNRRTCRQAA